MAGSLYTLDSGDTLANKLDVAESLLFLLVCAALIVSGVRIAKSTAQAKKSLLQEEQLLSSRSSPSFTSESGVDIGGRPVNPMPPPFELRAVAFLIRSSSVNSDLSFWTSVSNSLPKDSGIRLIGYCDNDSCIESTKTRMAVLPFTILAAGEVFSSEALIDADAHGEAIIRSEEWMRPQVRPWRMPEITPQQLVEVLSQL